MTTHGDASYGAESLRTLATLAAAHLRLISVDPSALHQRCVRVDKHIFRSDQSFRHLALQDGPLISEPVTDAAAHRELDDIIASGQVIV